MMSGAPEIVKWRSVFAARNFLGLEKLPDFGTRLLFVFAEFYFSAMFPTKDDSLGIDDDQFAWNETGILILQLGNLALAAQGLKIRAPGDGAGRNKIVSGNFDGFQLVLALHDFDDLVEMPGIMSDPLAFQI